MVSWGWGMGSGGIAQFKPVLGMVYKVKANVTMYTEEGSHANNKTKLLEIG